MAEAWQVAKTVCTRFGLNDGNMIPAFGLGVYLASAGEKGGTEKAVRVALQQGYRLIDTAEFYGNEEEVGQGISHSGYKRDDIFVVTKLCTWQETGTQRCLKAFDESIKKLGLSYVDMYLMHAPIAGKTLETYDAMLKLKEKGLTKSVGVSNFNINMLEGLRKSGRPTPAVNQIELHPFMRRKELVSYCRDHGILLMAFSPLGRCKKWEEPEVISMTKKYNKTAAQLFLRWCVQLGFIAIPKSTNRERIIENCQVFDWSITDEDMKILDNLPEESCIEPGSYISDIHDMEWNE